MSLRVAQSIADHDVHPMRDLAAQGCGNCVSALVAPVASAVTPNLLVTAYRVGGRTRLDRDRRRRRHFDRRRAAL